MQATMLFAIFSPVLFALALCVLRPKRKRLRFLLLFLGQGTAATALCGVFWAQPASLTLFSIPGALRFELAADRMGLFFAAVGTVVFTAAEVFMVRYMDKEEKVNRFTTFLLLSLGAFYGLCLAGNLITFYLFFEATTLLTFPLVLHEQSPEAMLGAKKYLFYSIGGAFLALGGMALFFADAGASASAGSFSSPALNVGTLGTVGAFLTVFGLCAKAGMFPLQAWLPAAHPVCPAPASALLSGLIVKAGVLGVIRTAYFAIDPSALRGSAFQIVLLVLACLTVVLGSTMAFFEPVLKRRLAFSTVSNLSYILSGLFLFTEGGLEGALLHVLAHAAAKTALFLCAGEIIFRTGKTRVSELRGLGKKMPFVFVFFLLAGLSLVGIPPFAGFASKWQLCVAAISQAPGAFAYVLPGCLLLSALLTAGYLFRPVISAFYEKKSEGNENAVSSEESASAPEVQPEKGSAWFSLPIAALCAAGLLLGVFSGAVGQWVASLTSL